MILHGDGGVVAGWLHRDNGSFFLLGGGGGLSLAGVWVQVPAANDRSTRRPSELLRPDRRPPPTGAFLYTGPQVGSTCLQLKAAQNENMGYLVGNTFGQLVPRVFSHLHLLPVLLVTMLTIYPVVHHVMKKASNCVYIPFIKRKRRALLACQLSSGSMMGEKSYSVLLGAVIIAFVYTPWQSLCFPSQSSSTYTQLCKKESILSKIISSTDFC